MQIIQSGIAWLLLVLSTWLIISCAASNDDKIATPKDNTTTKSGSGSTLDESNQTTERISGDTYTNSIGITFALIPKGSFMMGSNKSDSDEQPVHQVTIDYPFYMGVTEVTQGQYTKVMGKGSIGEPSYFSSCGDSCPVEQVSWRDAKAFIKKLNEMEGTGKYRLPSEAEWAYVARAGSTTKYHFGDDSTPLGEYAWYWDNSAEKTHPVGQKKPNAWGLYDMYGNVWEWVEDDYKNSYNHTPTDGQPYINPNAVYKSLRGGSWGDDARDLRSTLRFRSYPDKRYFSQGFRLLRMP